jgi:hypothetical protein
MFGLTLGRRGLLLGGGIAPVIWRAGYPQNVSARERQLIMPSTQLSFRLANGAYNSTGVPNATVSALHTLETTPSWVRLLHFNDQATPTSINGAAIALTSQVGDGFTPVGSAGVADTSQWQTVTYNNAGADVTPIAQTGGSAISINIPANTGAAGQPVQLFSDWVNLAPLQRSDGFGALLLIRIYVTGNLRFSSSGAPDPAIGRSFASSWSPGNATVAPWSFLQNQYPFGVPFGLQYLASNPGFTVLGVGDSIMSSLATTGGVSGFVTRACAMVSRPELPISTFNEGFAGRTTVDFMADGYSDITRLRPQIMVLQCFSYNDGGSLVAAQNAFERSIALAEHAGRNGCATVFCTAVPGGSYIPQQEPARVWSNNQVRALSAHGLPILDLDLLWGNGTSPNSYQVQYDSGDHAHPNDLACGVAAQSLAPILRNLIAS